jgi:hypothetical protein
MEPIGFLKKKSTAEETTEWILFAFEVVAVLVVASFIRSKFEEINHG